MTNLEKITSFLGMYGFPVGKLSPYNLVTDICPAFIQADELKKHAVDIPGRIMSTEKFCEEATNYLKLNLISDV